MCEACHRINESLDLDTVLQEVLDSARSLTGARYGVMVLLDGSGGVSPPLGLKPVLFTEGVHRLTVYFLPNLAELEWNLKTASQESSKD